MIAQYTQAALVSELKRLAVPASVDSIPSSAMQEDHVSMGWSAARKLRRAVDALTRVLAIEVADRRPRDRAARAARARARDAARSSRRCAAEIPGPGPDRFLAPEIETAVALVASGRVRAAAERSPAAALTASRIRDKATPALRSRGPPRSSRHGRPLRDRLRCWQQEAALRMLENNLHPDVAEQPEDLVVYGGIGKAARDQASLPTDQARADAPRATTRRCSCSRASPSPSSRPTSARRAC